MSVSREHSVLPGRSQSATAYVCPRCKGALTEFTCKDCGARYTVIEGMPCFLSEATGESTYDVREIYDEIYRHHEDVWVDQGRTGPFLRYFGDLAAGYSTGSVLEIGCGEGAQLAALMASRKFGIDVSLHALRRASKRSQAAFAIARAEELPFPAKSVDLVVAIGVMEHFEDPDAATAEIRRVLVPAGHYIVLIHTNMTLSQRLALKVREFFLPQPRPVALLRWVAKKVIHPIVQPLRKSYTVDTARQCLERNGLRVTQVITRDSQPTAPLAGTHVVILIAERPRP